MRMIFGQYSAGYKELLYAIFMDSSSTLYKVTVDWQTTQATQHLPAIAQQKEVISIDSGDGPVMDIAELFKHAEDFKDAPYSWVYHQLMSKVSGSELASKNPNPQPLGRVRKLPEWKLISHDFLCNLGSDWGTITEVMESLLNSKAGEI